MLRALATEDYDLMERLLRVVYALASVEAAVEELRVEGVVRTFVCILRAATAAVRRLSPAG